ncbi:MAG TPA: polymer-forming cytoskeletal protein [Bryobacterales bacterium]|jgi:cytoskeletal protein CcmA (bactofilin family)|nr:polymer-forming cytoskeletal protein [Bryobacterales bacterium]
MWGKNESPNSPAVNRPPAPAPARSPASTHEDHTPPALHTAPADRTEVVRSGQSVIGKSLVLKATISGSEDLYIDGKLEGSVEMHDHNVTIGPNGNVSANVVARNITVHGALRGDLRASGKIEVCKTGSLLGDVTTAGISIEDGAYFKGSVDIIRPDQKKEADSKKDRPDPMKPEPPIKAPLKVGAS